MRVIIRKATIVEPGSPLHGTVNDILVNNGTITEIGHWPDAVADREIDMPGLHVSTGWVDLFAHFCDPGQEQKETLQTGSLAAASGGFTDVLLVPNSQPAVSHKSAVEYIRHATQTNGVRLHPIGSISKQADGKELAEIYDMQQAGAVAFSDGWHPVQSAGLLLKALQYVKATDAPIIQLPEDKSLAGPGLIHEGIVSTQLGLPGKPALAEEMMIARDIELLRYTGSRLHLTGVSTRKGIALIQEAKAAGLSVTCSVTPYHLYFTDDALQQYDTNLKVVPPLRPAADRDALREALADGTIDCLATHHRPQHWDDKICEFEYAQYGMCGLESAFGVYNQLGLPLDQLIDMLTVKPRRIFNLPPVSIQTGSPACLTLFKPTEKYTFSKENIRSRSANNAFIGQPLTGSVVGIVQQQQLYINA